MFNVQELKKDWASGNIYKLPDSLCLHLCSIFTLNDYVKIKMHWILSSIVLIHNSHSEVTPCSLSLSLYISLSPNLNLWTLDLFSTGRGQTKCNTVVPKWTNWSMEKEREREKRQRQRGERDLPVLQRDGGQKVVIARSC